jgi:hypothetical protein
VWDADLGDQEWLARIANAADKLSKRLVLWFFLLLHKKLRRKEASFIPIMHLQTRKGALGVA